VRKSPVTHQVKSHTRNGKHIASFPRGHGNRRTRQKKIVNGGPRRFRLGNQMKTIMAVLSKSGRALSLTEIIIADRGLEKIKGKGSRLISSVAGKVVKEPFADTRDLVESRDKKDDTRVLGMMRAGVEEYDQAYKITNNLYASYSRSVNTLLGYGLIESTNMGEKKRTRQRAKDTMKDLGIPVPVNDTIVESRKSGQRYRISERGRAFLAV
jgi:hypothetical protein